jgi:hypothetical protein
MKNVPADRFWSVSVYNAEGYFQKKPGQCIHPSLYKFPEAQPAD